MAPLMMDMSGDGSSARLPSTFGGAESHRHEELGGLAMTRRVQHDHREPLNLGLLADISLINLSNRPSHVEASFALWSGPGKDPAV